VLLLCASAAQAQSGGYDLSWNTIDGGGGTSTGGGYTLSGTIGQSDAGSLSGASCTIKGGFWGSSGVSVPAAAFWTWLSAGALLAALGSSRRRGALGAVPVKARSLELRRRIP
jgi:hypothetical protein